MKLFFAPLQGYTDHHYRRLHHTLAGGVDTYFSPFLRWDGALRNKDLRDIQPDNNSGVPLVPQVICADGDELAHLLDVLQPLGYRQVDINMGCPFPLQTARGRGSALLARDETLASVLHEMERRPELTFSVKMRSGFTSVDEGLRCLQRLNDLPLQWVTLHPRLGRQQYKGTPDMEAFAQLASVCQHPVVYNGDLHSRQQIDDLQRTHPTLFGVMLGRGLLARPTLACEWRQQQDLTDSEVLQCSLRLHRQLYDEATRTLQGDQQILSRMRAYWEYQQPLIDKKVYKRLMKSGSCRNYEEAVALLSHSLPR